MHESTLLDRLPRKRATLYKVWHCRAMGSDVCLILNFNRKKVESIILDHYMYFFKMKRGIVHIKNSRRRWKQIDLFANACTCFRRFINWNSLFEHCLSLVCYFLCNRKSTHTYNSFVFLYISFFLVSSSLLNFIKKETLAQVLSFKSCEISKNTFFNRTLLLQLVICRLHIFLICTGKIQRYQA